ncbi:hypothetical protein N825_32685 [Skermanella stibiiresistens SB22]|uniref:Uncharacterized protein n=1 Tax=Skermanella stibiiresistens SB22 TaxID=1385369 RepID=W9H3C7_9PROT|nr:hypothetical protein [Skermanella stibiiresistens]EWY40685.1 hypothetical protein N825_32685 [Skermanella stibiiresistens SB22]
MGTDLSRDDFLLDESDKPLALRQGQTQIPDVAQIAGMINHHHVDAAARSIDSGFHQAQNPPHP